VRIRPLVTALVITAASLAVVRSALEAASAAASARRISYTHWGTAKQLDSGSAHGVVVQGGRLVVGSPAGTRGGYDYGTWTSPWVTPGYDLTELIPSWNGTTRRDTWVKVEVRGRRASGTSSWDRTAGWALDDLQHRRASGTSQTDDFGHVSYDTWLTSGVGAWQVRLTLLRKAGTTATPEIEAVGAVASRLPAVSSVATSSPGTSSALGTVLPVPSYSQMVHRNEYPQYDGGGEAWCSPTSTTMVLAYYHALPPRSDYAWVSHAYTDRVVDHAARMTYDTHLGGTGNWAFNTAYAASRTGAGFVTRLRNLRGAEDFIAAGIPLVASITFSSGQLSGAPISSSNGHLVVIVGFRKNGNVVVNDPAAPTRAGVRRTYDRGQFEDAWLKRYPSGSSMRGSGGLVYVIRDSAHPLPARSASSPW
jgi:hypothetical protein